MHGFNRVAAAPGEIPGEKVDHIDRRQALACSGITPPKMPLSMENWETRTTLNACFCISMSPYSIGFIRFCRTHVHNQQTRGQILRLRYICSNSAHALRCGLKRSV